MSRTKLQLPSNVPALRASQDKKKEEVTMIQQLKNFDVDRMDLDELVGLASFGRIIGDEFDKLSGEIPEWLQANLKSLRREIHARQADALEALLKEKKARRDNLTPAEERRKKLDEEIAALEAKVSQVGV